MNHSDFDPDKQGMNIESRIVVSLERISQAFRVLLWQESKKFSLSPIQVQLLIFLLHHSEGKRKVSYLAEEFNMAKATISDTVKTLEQKKLIQKLSEQNDTRSYTIHLTEKGRELAESTSFFSEQIRVPIESMHSDDKENLLLSLLNIIRHLNKTGVITKQRMCLNCSFYRPLQQENTFFCSLLNQQLSSAAMRIDCTDHVLKHDIP